MCIKMELKIESSRRFGFIARLVARLSNWIQEVLESETFYTSTKINNDYDGIYNKSQENCSKYWSWNGANGKLKKHFEQKKY